MNNSKVKGKQKDSLALTSLLSEKKGEIFENWIELIQQHSELKDNFLSVEQLRQLAMGVINAIVEFLETGSNVKLNRYLEQLNLTTLSMDTNVTRATDMIFLLKDAAMVTIKKFAPPRSTLAFESCTRLNAVLRYSIGFISRNSTTLASNEIRKQQEHTASLLKILRAATSTLDLKEVLQQVGDAINEVVGTPFCGFSLIDEERNLVVPQKAKRTRKLKDHFSSSSTIHPMSLTNLDPFEQDVLEIKEPIICKDAYSDPRVLKEWSHNYGVKSILAIPFIVKKRVVAIAFALTFDEVRDFNLEEVELSMGSANVVALTIENARLYKKSKEMAVLEERERLANELHDNLAQSLGALQLKASEVAAYLNHGRKSKAKCNLNELQDMISESHVGVRETIFNMRTVFSPTNSFLSSLREYLNAYHIRYGVDVQLSIEEGLAFELEADIELQVMRIIQESLINVRKHAQIDNAIILVKKTEESLTITMRDYGCGFDPSKVMSQAGHHLGLQIMYERAKSIPGAGLFIASEQNKGTKITLSLPISILGVKQ